jgi:hypothetical protein
MTYTFTIAHSTEGRTRIRWAGDVSEKTRIGELAESIAGLSGVDRAVPRMTTGSIIIEHEHEVWSSIEPRLCKDLSVAFRPTAAATQSGLQALNHELDRVDGALRKGINIDLPSASVILLLILAITQAVRGQVMGNSMSFIWYALSIAAMARNSADTGADTTTAVAE